MRSEKDEKLEQPSQKETTRLNANQVELRCALLPVETEPTFDKSLKSVRLDPNKRMVSQYICMFSPGELVNV